jgi:hypothetical protein
VRSSLVLLDHTSLTRGLPATQCLRTVQCSQMRRVPAWALGAEQQQQLGQGAGSQENSNKPEECAPTWWGLSQSHSSVQAGMGLKCDGYRRQWSSAGAARAPAAALRSAESNRAAAAVWWAESAGQLTDSQKQGLIQGNSSCEGAGSVRTLRWLWGQLVLACVRQGGGSHPSLACDREIMASVTTREGSSGEPTRGVVTKITVKRSR